MKEQLVNGVLDELSVQPLLVSQFLSYQLQEMGYSNPHNAVAVRQDKQSS